MEAAIIIGILAVLIGIGISIPKINKKCLAEYEYKPFSIGNAALSLLSVIILFSFFVVSKEEGSITPVMSANAWVILGLYSTIVIGLLWNIISKTSLAVGLYTVVILQFTSLVAVAILFAARALWVDSKERSAM